MSLNPTEPMPSPATVPGWFIDSTVDRPRYWDGIQWSDVGPNPQHLAEVAASRKTRDIDGIPLRPVAAVKSAYRNMFRMRGRASRSAFWWFIAWSYGFLMLVVSAAFAVFSAIPSWDPDVAAGAASLVLLAATIPHWIAGVTLTGRRLHDANLSAGFLWLYLVPYVGPLAIAVMALQGPRDPNDYDEP